MQRTKPSHGRRDPRGHRGSASAERPVILAGGGVLRARTSTDLLRFADLLQVPIVAAWRRADVVSNDRPLYLGMAGLGAAPSVRDRLLAADAMLVIEPAQRTHVVG